MDVNCAHLEGRLALPADLERLPDGSRRAHLLLCVRGDGRLDVVPVLVPSGAGVETAIGLTGGSRVAVRGALMRRGASGNAMSSGRIEVVAHSIESLDAKDDSDGG